MSNEGLPRFSGAEMRRRHDAARALMAHLEVDALLVCGSSGSRRHSQADVHYLAEVASYHDSHLLMPLRGEPVLWILPNNHFQSARELSYVFDVRRATRGHATQPVAAEIGARALSKARIGIVGGLPYQEMDALRAALPGATLLDLSMPFKRLRMKKSEEELQYQRIAAAGCDAVMAAVRATIRPGVEERDLLVLSEEVAWREGCQPNFLYLNSTSMAASDSCVPNQHLSRRKLRMGDVINTELTVSYGMYSAQLLRPFFLGEPTPEYARLYDVLKRVHDRMQVAMVAGTSLARLHEISCEFRDAGYSTVDGVLHGFAVDILPPRLAPRFVPPGDEVLEAGTTVVLQPNPTSLDERMGMQLGQMGLITSQGFESMHASPAEVTYCG